MGTDICDSLINEFNRTIEQLVYLEEERVYQELLPTVQEINKRIIEENKKDFPDDVDGEQSHCLDYWCGWDEIGEKVEEAGKQLRIRKKRELIEKLKKIREERKLLR